MAEQRLENRARATTFRAACLAVALGWLSLAPPGAMATPSGAGGAPAASPSTSKSTSAVAPKANTWSVLVQPKQRWVLHDSSSETPKRVIVVETYDTHQVGAASVARLRWTAKEDLGGDAKDASNIGAEDGPAFTHLAVTDRGLYILRENADDAAIAKQVQGKPSRPEPPRAFKGTKKNQGRYLDIHKQADGPVTCIGFGPEPDAAGCDSVCVAEMCLSPAKGVVQLSGKVTPDFSIFAQKGFKLE